MIGTVGRTCSIRRIPGGSTTRALETTMRFSFLNHIVARFIGLIGKRMPHPPNSTAFLHQHPVKVKVLRRILEEDPVFGRSHEFNGFTLETLFSELFLGRAQPILVASTVCCSKLPPGFDNLSTFPHSASRARLQNHGTEVSLFGEP